MEEGWRKDGGRMEESEKTRGALEIELLPRREELEGTPFHAKEFLCDGVWLVW